MPAIRHDDTLLRIIKDLNDVRSALRRVVATLPLYDIDNENTPAVITTDQDNYVPGNYDVLKLQSSKSVSITGIRNGVRGRNLRIFNIGSFPIYFIEESTDSLPENRFDAGVSVPLLPGDCVTFYYDESASRWKLISYSSLQYSISINFSPQKLPSSLTVGLFAVASNDTVIVALSNLTNVFYSSDGVNWSSGVMPAVGGNWLDVVWAESIGLFCAVNDNGKKATSADGINWNLYTSSPIGNVAIAWSPSLALFVSVGQGSPYIQTSPDGQTWTNQVSPEAHSWFGVAWSPGLSMFVKLESATITVSLLATAKRPTVKADGSFFGEKLRDIEY